MIKRELYLKKLMSFCDKPLIKVITGMRRCGKSTLLQQFKEYLFANGIKDESVIQMNFESMKFDEIKNYNDLYAYVKAQIKGNGRTYLLLDEVQQVVYWEKAVNAFLVDFNVDIYITGSNAWLLSSEIATLLSGRYVEIKMLPLSFKEYLSARCTDKVKNKENYFNEYLRYGGLPTIAILQDRPETIQPFLSGIYNTVLMKDIVQRNAVRDTELLDSLTHFLADNIGNMVSSKKISDYLTSAGRKTNSYTIDNYVHMLEMAFIFYKASRYDIKGKLHLKTQEKYYIVDNGLRNNLLGFRNADYGHILENVVYLELLRREYEVYVGKLGNYEVDFVAIRADKKIYYQVAASILDTKVRERELRPLQQIPDQYEKVILTMDRSFINDFNGIRNMNIIDFLLDDNE